MWVGLGTDVGRNGDIIEEHGQWEGPAWSRGLTCVLHTVADLGVAGSFCLPGMVVGKVSLTAVQ